MGMSLESPRCCLRDPRALPRSHGFLSMQSGHLPLHGPRGHIREDSDSVVGVAEGSLSTQFTSNGHGARTSKTVVGDTTEYVLDLRPARLSSSAARSVQR
jgi:hypothetical protein